MHQPRLRAAAVNALPALFAGRIPTRYCDRCLEDLATVQRLWREAALTNPGVGEQMRSSRVNWLTREARRLDASTAARGASLALE